MYKTVNEANAAVIERLKAARPHWVDVKTASEVIPELREGRTLLHAGPPIAWERMTGPMQGAVIGAAKLEGWAQTDEEATELAAAGGIRFIPCHDVNAVGPMGGITSASMPVIVMENKVHGNFSYCNLNEGIGKVMRFGAYDEEVLARHRWMIRTLGPVLSAALRTMPDGIDVTTLIAQAVTMGDEFHQRNIAASALLLRSLAVAVMKCGRPLEECQEVADFLARTDQFFLNVMMAYCKCVMDAGAVVGEGTIVTCMTRNGRDFGVRVAGTGKQWFTAPVNTPVGLFFTGYTQEDANTEIGDSAITETYGVGGASMVAAPGVTRFVGAGGFQDALRISDEMQEIYADSNPMLLIPGWDFQGAPMGLDIRRVVETGITPVINTGIAHKEAGIGQVGAGTVRAPLDCFVKAFEAAAEKLGLEA